jgi:hypothetical protein
MAKIAIIPPNLPFFFDFSCQTQDCIQTFLRKRKAAEYPLLKMYFD